LKSSPVVADAAEKEHLYFLKSDYQRKVDQFSKNLKRRKKYSQNISLHFKPHPSSKLRESLEATIERIHFGKLQRQRIEEKLSSTEQPDFLSCNKKAALQNPRPNRALADMQGSPSSPVLPLKISDKYPDYLPSSLQKGTHKGSDRMLSAALPKEQKYQQLMLYSNKIDEEVKLAAARIRAKKGIPNMQEKVQEEFVKLEDMVLDSIKTKLEMLS